MLGADFCDDGALCDDVELVWQELCGRNLRCLPVGASGPVRPCGATLPTAWAPSAREAADGYTVPKAPAGYALINVIDIIV